MTSAHASSVFWLLCRTGSHLCALPLDGVIETLRPLPIERLLPGPPFVRGLCIIRGAPIPVLDLASMFGEQATRPDRLVTIKLGGRVVALLVDAVEGVRAISADRYERLPPLLADSAGEIVSAIGILDEELLLFLHAARMVPPMVLEGNDRSTTV